jgi:hypothetical protein
MQTWTWKRKFMLTYANMNMKTKIYYVNICKHEHEKNITRLWCKIVLKTNVEQTKHNGKLYFYLYPLGT